MTDRINLLMLVCVLATCATEKNRNPQYSAPHDTSGGYTPDCTCDTPAVFATSEILTSA